MRNDYSNAVLATASEQELAEMVATMAETQERGLVLQLWQSKEEMQKAWARWMDGYHPAESTAQVQPEQLWILKLVESLGKPQTVASQLISPSLPHETTSGLDGVEGNTRRAPEPPNMLPPQFVFSGPALFRIQNSIQALTIAASLKSLVPTLRPAATPPVPSQSRVGDPMSPINQEFTERIWALLETEIGTADDGPSETKIINLADEVVIAHRSALPPDTTLDPHLEQRLRGAVDRILRINDPVFILLQKRLLVALSAAVLSPPVTEEHASVRMRSGRPWPRRGPTSPSPSPPHTVQSEVVIVAKGFEDPVIAKQCSLVASMLRRTVEWVERVWSETIP